MTHCAWKICLISSVIFASTITSLFATSILPNLSPSGVKTPAEKAYLQGQQELSSGNANKAESSFQNSVKLDPKFFPPLLGLAEIALNTNRPDEAKRHLQQALTLAPDRALVQTTWGRYLHLQGRLSDAEAAYKKAMVLDPSLVFPHADLGALYALKLNQPQKAMDAYRTALKIAPNNSRIRYALGVVLASMKKTGSARTEFEKAAELAPTNPLIFQALGNLHASQQHYDKALKAFEGALKAQPTFYQGHMARGEVFMLQGKSDQALAEYKAARKIAPKFVPILIKTGTVYAQLHRYEDAEQVYLDAMALDPKQAFVYNNLAYMRVERLTGLDQALTWAKRAVELEPTSASYKDTLGWVHHARGEKDQALGVLKEVTAKGTQHADPYYHLGVVYAEMENTQEAKRALNKALALDQNFAMADDARRLLEKIRAQ